MRSRFQLFVALRYLVAHPTHVSRLALIVAAVIGVAAVVLFGVHEIFLTPPDPRSLVPKGDPEYYDVVLARQICTGVALFVLYVFVVRMVFTFYSTVSIVGVSIGSAALVLVLSIMNGFESDLRSKILGSNAHIQIGKVDGEFIEWPEIRAKVDQLPGVVASTPFATSEVVIAANSNYFNVVVKGIDVESAIKVTDLKRNLKDPEGFQFGDSLERLAPQVADDPPPLVEPDPVPAPSDEPLIDPAPDDMPGGGAAVDYSGGGAADEPDEVDDDRVFPETDKAPDDFAGGEGEDDEPMPPAIDYSQPARRTVRSSGQRIQSLPGVLVGRELVKQIHCYTDQEVRLVSPLADPMNPDATGTPIPYNKDYRVAGQFFTGMYEYDLKLVYVSLESLQQFLRMGDAVDGIEVRISDPDNVAGVVDEIQAALGPEYRVQGWQELNRNLFSALKLEKIAMFMVLAIIILVASFSIVSNLIMTVVEKGREIALLKTLGAGDGGIILVFVIQGFLIGVVGTTLGVVAGVIGSWRIAVDGIPINRDVYYIDRLPIELDLFTVGLVFVAGLVISVAATIYPALVASDLRPAQGLKQ